MAGVAPTARAWWEQNSLQAYNHTGHGSLRSLCVRESKTSSSKMVILTVSGNPQYAISKEEIDKFKQCILRTVPVELQETLSIFLILQHAIPKQRTTFTEYHLHGPSHLQETIRIGEKEWIFCLSPSSFFQPNVHQTEQLYQRALDLASPSSDTIVFDLYCGTATLGICFSQKARHVVGVEINPDAVLDAQSNMATNQVSNMEIHCRDVQSFLLEKSLDVYGKGIPSLVIVDPPRPGLSPHALQSLANFSPNRILYISCNPLTQARDIDFLIRYGFCLKHVQPVDHFPHTPHIENICILDLLNDLK